MLSTRWNLNDFCVKIDRKKSKNGNYGRSTIYYIQAPISLFSKMDLLIYVGGIFDEGSRWDIRLLEQLAGSLKFLILQKDCLIGFLKKNGILKNT